MKKRGTIGTVGTMICLAGLLCAMLAGCGGSTVPNPEVEEYLNTGMSAKQAYELVEEVSYTVSQSQQDKAGNELGNCLFQVVIDKTDADDLKMDIIQTYSGSFVEEGIEYKEACLKRVDGVYLYTIINGEQERTDEVEEQFALDYITSFFYRNNNAYDEGGLYYGDFFMLYIYKYPADSFYVDRELNLCVFDEKMDIQDEEAGDVLLHQISKINSAGLLESNYERYESVETDFVLLSELKAEYTYVK